jgi:signal transduction histidine kinase
MKKAGCEFCQHDFLAVLSHELRNPLSALSNSLYVVKKCPPGQPRSLRAIAVMERQLRHMTSLIDSLTEAARLGSGRVELRRSTLDLCELLHNACLDHECLLATCAIELHEEIPRGPLWVSADATRLTQVFGNLLQNAAQFTPAGGSVTLVLERDETQQLARIRCRDSGMGLPPGLRERLFAPFAQADTSLARSSGGLGLGLHLVKGIVDLHGGSVRAESAGPGQGSTFIVELPCLGPGPLQR